MSTTATITTPTPASEHSIYFDAPILNVKSSAEPNPSDSTDAPAPSTAGPQTMPPSASAAPAADPSSAGDKSDVERKNSVTPSVAVGRKRSLLSKLRKKPEPDGQQRPAVGPIATATAADGPNTTNQRFVESSRSPVDADAVLSRDYGAPKPAQAASASSLERKRTAPAPAAPSSQAGRSVRPGDDLTDDEDARTASDDGSDDDDAPASYVSPVSRSSHHRRRQTVDLGRSGSRRSLAASSVARPRSVDGGVGAGGRSSRRSLAPSGRSSVGGAFVNGAGTIGPGAELDAEDAAPFRERARAAHAGLDAKAAKRIGKEELKEGKRLNKILKNEGKVERAALEVAMKELAELQTLQKRSVKEELRAHSAHAKTLKHWHAAELTFLEAQRKFSLAQAELRAKDDALEYARTHAAESTQRVQEKNREVEMLRVQKAADSRERESKMRRLVGKA